MELVFLVMVFVAVLAIAAVAFCVWLVTTIFRGLLGIVSAKREARLPGSQACSNADCRCANPGYARFCRRCGRSLPALLRAVSSRAAVL